MGKKTRRQGPLEYGPSWPESDDLIVDTLLRVGSGLRVLNPRAEEAARAQAPEFARVLERAIVDGLDELRGVEFKSRIEELVNGGVAVVPRGAMDGARLRLGYYREFRDLHAALTNGVLLLIDPDKRYGRTLSKCNHCQRFYLARRNPKGGPANRLYCSPACRTKAHDATREVRRARAARKHK